MAIKLQRVKPLDPTAKLFKEAVANMRTSIWYFGDDEPDIATGKEGDLYLNKTTYDYYQRTDEIWSKQGNLKGADGRDRVSVSKLEPSNPIEGDMWVNNGLFVMVAGHWREVSGKAGLDAKNINIRAHNNNVEWQYEGSDNWNQLYSVNDLVGPRGLKGERGVKGDKGDKGEQGKDGREIELRKTADYIQWHYVGDSKWRNLIALADLKGEIIFQGGGGGIGSGGKIKDINVLSNVTIDKTNPKIPVIGLDFHLTVAPVAPLAPNVNDIWIDTS